MNNSLTLNNGQKMPLLGLGTWLSQPNEVGKAVEFALKNGYRLLDCAHVYMNQKEIGEVLKNVFKNNQIKREDIFITSKIWNTDHRYEKAIEAVDVILKDLGIDYLDLCLIHWPMGFKEGDQLFPEENKKILYSNADYVDTWKALEYVVQTGKVKSIGLSNFNIHQIGRVLQDCKIIPAVLQIELHPYFQQTELVEFCKKHTIAVTAYSSFINPQLNFCGKGDLNVFTDKVLTEIAKKHGKTNAQVILKAIIQMNIAVIPKSVNENRIIENSNIWDFTLDDVDLENFKKLDRNYRSLDPKSTLGDHPHFPW